MHDTKAKGPRSRPFRRYMGVGEVGRFRYRLGMVVFAPPFEWFSYGVGSAYEPP